MNRRQFLHTGTAATVGLAMSSPAFAVSREKTECVDVNVSLGRWPGRSLPWDETTVLIAKLRARGVVQAWAGNFDCVFGKNLSTANKELAYECQKHGRRFLLPFGSVNLALPDWETEFERCVGQYAMRGLRLFPNYHGYNLATPAFAKLLALAVRKNVVVQIAADLEDERTQADGQRVPHVDSTPLLAVLKRRAGARVVLLNWWRAVKPELVRELAAAGVCFDISTVEGVGGVAEVIRKISVEHVVFGSHAPLFYFESATLKLKESALQAADTTAICRLNAHRLLA